MAVKLATTPNRHIAGIIEVFLKKFVADKTSWSKMLKGEIPVDINLLTEKDRIAAYLPGELGKYIETDNTVFTFSYPVISIPANIKQVGFDDSSHIKGTLTGIKGQYLIFDDGKVFNVRKHNGYFTEIDVFG
jgi:hypothetical protein